MLNRADLTVQNWLYVVLAGSPPLTGTATITVKILDANDNAPVIKYLPDYPLVVPARTRQGERVFCFTAEEPDMSLNPTFTFTYLCNVPHCTDFDLRPLQTGLSLLIIGNEQFRSAILNTRYPNPNCNCNPNPNPNYNNPNPNSGSSE